MSIVISIAFSVVIALLSIWVWSKYDALKLSDFNTNKKEVILSSNGFNTTNKILCVKSNSHEVYVDLG